MNIYSKFIIVIKTKRIINAYKDTLLNTSNRLLSVSIYLLHFTDLLV